MQSQLSTDDVRVLHHIRAQRRAERLMLDALSCLLDNHAFDQYWINQGDLTPEWVLRGGQVNAGALCAFMEVLAREFGGAR